MIIIYMKYENFNIDGCLETGASFAASSIGIVTRDLINSDPNRIAKRLEQFLSDRADIVAERYL